MDMKKVLLALFAVVLAAGCQKAEKEAVIDFSVLNRTAGSVIVVCQNNMQRCQLDENGNAQVVIAGVDAAYAKVFYGMNQMKVYVEAGDKAQISFDANDFVGTFDFQGKKKSAVEYLNNVTLASLPDEDFALPFEQYREKLEGKCNDALKLLKANSIKGAGDFVKMEQARIRYAYATPLLMYPVGHALMAREAGYAPDQAYYDLLKEYFVENDDYVDIDEYRNFIIEAAHVLDEKNRDVKQLNAKTVAQMRYITDHFTSSKVNSALLHYLASSYVDTFGIDGIDEMLSIYRTYVKDDKLAADFARKYDRWDRSKPGKPSPDFKAVDIDGKEWTLADFKGKYVYIDMWATWCKPCRQELPHLVELEKKFADAQIVFLGLSTDGDKAAWEKVVRAGGMCGTQLYIGARSSFQTAYNIKGIPRFILLDKEGIIINNDMSRPSSPDTEKVLSALAGIR
jgi:thiol-disulfide isomerase/thioredoxin